MKGLKIMLKTYKDLMKGSWLISWNGIQNAIILTNNRFMKLLGKGIDSQLNVVALKLVYKYDYPHFIESLKVGLEFVYQTYTYTMQLQGKLLFLQVVHTKTNKVVFNHRISNTSINHMQELNEDIRDLCKGLVKRGII